MSIEKHIMFFYRLKIFTNSLLTIADDDTCHDPRIALDTLFTHKIYYDVLKCGIRVLMTHVVLHCFLNHNITRI